MSDCMTQEDAMNMDEEQAIQILKPLRDMMIDQHGRPISSAVFALDKAIKALEHPEQRWIPCSERLPESGVSVLISHVGFVTEDFLDIDELLGAEYFWNSGISLDEELNNLAWMPLPAPWKGEEDE